MKKKREIRDYINDIIDNMNKAIKFVADVDYKDFINNEEKIYAVVKAIEIIGEAAKNIPSEIRDKYQEIPWRDITGMRDKVIHEYFGIDYKVVWDTVKEDIPSIKPVIEKILKDLEE